MVRLTPSIEIIQEHEVRLDEDTTSTFVTAQLLSAEDWFKPLVIRRLQPAYAARAEQFCAALERWTVNTSQVSGVFAVMRDDDPFAIQEYPGDRRLAELIDVPLAPQLRARIAGVVHGGLADELVAASYEAIPGINLRGAASARALVRFFVEAFPDFVLAPGADRRG